MNATRFPLSKSETKFVIIILKYCPKVKKTACNVGWGCHLWGNQCWGIWALWSADSKVATLNRVAISEATKTEELCALWSANLKVATLTFLVWRKFNYSYSIRQRFTHFCSEGYARLLRTFVCGEYADFAYIGIYRYKRASFALTANFPRIFFFLVAAFPAK